jgi:hypothetical protein
MEIKNTQTMQRRWSSIFSSFSDNKKRQEAKKEAKKQEKSVVKKAQS